MAAARRGDGRPRTTYMADAGDGGALRGDREARVAGGGGDLLPGSLHARRVGGDGASLGGRPAAGARAAVRRDRTADGGLDDDRDAGRALAPPRRGRLPAG